MLLQISCKEKAKRTQPSYQYDKMLFIRNGGGDKVFNVIPTTTADAFQVNVSRLDFQDTTITMTLSRDSTNAIVFDALTKSLCGLKRLTGDFQQSTLPTGSWAYIYIVKGNTKTEITNTQLRDTLMAFENIVAKNFK